MTALLSIALAAPWTMTDVDVEHGGDPVVLVVTPGVEPEAFTGWSLALRRRGLDVHLATLEPTTGPEEAIHELHAALDELEASLGPLKLAGHGYGGLLVLLSGYAPERLALIAVPLAAQPVAVLAKGGDHGLPWPDELVGDYPAGPIHPDLSAAFAAWAAELPGYRVPDCPVLVASGNRDVVAPPEVVRPPSQGWPDRSWDRLGFLALEPERLHMEVLAHEGLATTVARFLDAP